MSPKRSGSKPEQTTTWVQNSDFFRFHFSFYYEYLHFIIFSEFDLLCIEADFCTQICILIFQHHFIENYNIFTLLQCFNLQKQF